MPPSRRCIDTGRRAAFGYFESAGAAILGTNPGNQYPTDATRIKKQWFSSSDQLVTMIMGGEVYLPGYEAAWNIGRDLGLQIAAHILSPFGIRPTLDQLAKNTLNNTPNTLKLGPDNLFIHMTGMSNLGWEASQERRRAGVARSPNRDEHAPWDAADLEDAEARPRAVALRRRRMHVDGGFLHADALRA